MNQSGILVGISLVCLFYLVILTELGKYLVGIRYELYILYYGLGFIPICIHRLGHTRLSIHDLTEAGHQPMLTPNNN